MVPVNRAKEQGTPERNSIQKRKAVTTFGVRAQNPMHLVFNLYAPFKQDGRRLGLRFGVILTQIDD